MSGTGIAGTNDTLGGAISAGTYSSDFFFVSQIQSGTNGTQAGISIRNGTSGTATNVANVSLQVRPGSTGIFQSRRPPVLQQQLFLLDSLRPWEPISLFSDSKARFMHTHPAMDQTGR